MLANLFRSIVILVSTFLVPLSARAVEIEQDYGGMSVVNLGVQEERAFFNVAERPAQTRPGGGCLYELYYVKLDTPGGRALYATLLNAKSMGKKLRRFDWERQATSNGGVCFVNLVLPQD